MRTLKKLLMVSAVPMAAMICSPPVSADDETLTLVKTIDLQADNPLLGFDISFVNPKLGLYIFADRSNGSVDVFDSRDATFSYRVGGFTGLVLKPDGTANNALSGPDGVLFVGNREIWAGDGDSTVKVIDVASRQIVAGISTGGTKRVDEMAYDPDDHIIAVANNADEPPFVTLINTDTREVLGQIKFDGKNNTPDATLTGVEQPAYSRRTGLFYISVPQIAAGDANAAKGGVTAIDPRTMQVVQTFEVDNCSPAGLAVGPHNDVLVGCGGAFDKKTQSAILNVESGAVDYLPFVGGSDQVWYDAGTHHYFLAARANLDSAGVVAPVVGTIDALSHRYDGGTPSSVTAHSVAADKKSNLVFVPIGGPAPGVTPPAKDPTNPCPDPAMGCVAVYALTSVEQ